MAAVLTDDRTAAQLSISLFPPGGAGRIPINIFTGPQLCTPAPVGGRIAGEASIYIAHMI